MTREAALLGIPTVSIYAGEPAAVDLYLENAGRLRRLTDNAPLELTPRSTQPVRSRGPSAAGAAHHRALRPDRARIRGKTLV